MSKQLLEKNWNAITRAYAVQYVCDTKQDVNTLPVAEISAGSTALCIDEGMIYIFNETWKPYGKAKTSGGGASAELIDKTITANGSYNAVDDGVDGFSSVSVDVPQVELENINITENGTYTSEDGKAFNEVNVNVPSAGSSVNMPESTPYLSKNGTYDFANTDYIEVKVAWDEEVVAEYDEEDGTEIYGQEEYEKTYVVGSNDDAYRYLNDAEAFINVMFGYPEYNRYNCRFISQKRFNAVNKVNVNVPVPNLVTGTFRQNGTYNGNYNRVVVDVGADNIYITGDNGVKMYNPGEEDSTNLTVLKYVSYTDEDDGETRNNLIYKVYGGDVFEENSINLTMTEDMEGRIAISRLPSAFKSKYRISDGNWLYFSQVRIEGVIEW